MGRDLAALEELEGLIGGLLHQIDASGRRKILTAIARNLRKGQVSRIRAQKNVDGSAYAPRAALRSRDTIKKKLARRAMFRRLRTNRFFKTGVTDREMWLGFVGRAAQLANVHQQGLEDRPAKGMPKVKYPVREVIGFSDDQRESLLDTVLQHIDAPFR